MAAWRGNDDITRRLFPAEAGTAAP